MGKIISDGQVSECQSFPRSFGQNAVLPESEKREAILQRHADSIDNNGRESLTPCLAAKKADVFVFSCTKTGQYEARQCQMFMSCWCVDPTTGVEIPGTRRQFHKGGVECSRQIAK
ncbi:hypothetical protein LSAT2_012012 [Lamellibrachia satsuma]|nr:hypothetical protein LSAT2_012012 [Lamellibrachia satsuma]